VQDISSYFLLGNPNFSGRSEGISLKNLNHCVSAYSIFTIRNTGVDASILNKLTNILINFTYRPVLTYNFFFCISLVDLRNHKIICKFKKIFGKISASSTDSIIK